MSDVDTKKVLERALLDHIAATDPDGEHPVMLTSAVVVAEVVFAEAPGISLLVKQIGAPSDWATVGMLQAAMDHARATVQASFMPDRDD